MRGVLVGQGLVFAALFPVAGIVGSVAAIAAVWKLSRPRRVTVFEFSDIGIGVMVPTGVVEYLWRGYWAMAVGAVGLMTAAA